MDLSSRSLNEPAQPRSSTIHPKEPLSKKAMPEYDCIIIGAGYAGLSAAKALKQNGKNVIVLEARERVGGRAYTKPYPDGSYNDFGASYIGAQHQRMHRLVEEYHVRMFDAPTRGQRIYYSGGVAKLYSGFTPPAGILHSIDLYLALRKFESLASTVDVEHPWKTPKAEALDHATIEQWIQKTCWTARGRDLFRLCITMTWAAHPSQISLLHGLWFSKAGVSLSTITSTEGGAQQYLVCGGGQTVANKLYGELKNEIFLKAPVIKVDQNSASHIVVHTKQESYTAQSIIMTIPPPLIAKVDFTPPLPASKVHLLQRMPMGASWKVLAHYESPFWRESGLCGEAISPDALLSAIEDSSPEDGSRGTLLAFVTGANAYKLASLTENEKRREVTKNLVACFGERAAQLTRLSIHSMMNDPWSTGCPVSAMAPGTWTVVGEWMRKEIDRIHWAGTETATSWSGYMEGAVESGYRAAEEVIEALK